MYILAHIIRRRLKKLLTVHDYYWPIKKANFDHSVESWETDGLLLLEMAWYL